MAVLLFFSIFCLSLFSDHQNDPKTISRNFQEEIIAAENDLKNIVDKSIGRTDSSSMLFSNENRQLLSQKNNKEAQLFIFRQDSLIYWSTNKITLTERSLVRGAGYQGMHRLQNGWYLFHSERSGRFLFTASCLVKSEFPFQNDFIKNAFSPRFTCPETVAIVAEKGTFPINSSSGIFMVSLDFSHFKSNRVFSPLLLFLLFIAGSLFLIYFIYRMYTGLNWFDNRKTLMVLFFGSDLILLRVFQYWLRLPEALYQSELFSPALYSSTALLPSLGDFTLNALLFGIISLAVYLNFQKRYSVQGQNPRTNLGVDFAAVLLLIFLFHFAGFLISSLVINSSISLNLQNVSALSSESGFGLIIISLVLGSFWLISTPVFNYLFSYTNNLRKLVFVTIISGLCYLMLVWFATGDMGFSILLFFLIYFAAFWYIKSRTPNFFSVQNILFFICFYAVFGTFLLNRTNEVKQEQKLDLLAVKLSTRRNPVTEVMYEQLERKIASDSGIRGMMVSLTGNSFTLQDSLSNYLKKRYFKNYWQKYNVQVTICDTAKELKILPMGYLVNCRSYFRGIIDSYGEETSFPALFYLDYGFGKEYYLAIISGDRFPGKPGAKQDIIIELNLLNVYPDPGYPGLLMDKTRIDLPNISDFSYGLFQNGRLVHSVGSYNYKLELSQYAINPAPSRQFTEEGMTHYQYPVNDSSYLLISKQEDTLLAAITPFSYLFLLFSIITFIAGGVVIFPKNIRLIPSSLRNRLHFSLLGILVMTFMVIGIVQVINIIDINTKKNEDGLKEKAYSIQVEVQHKYGNLNEIGEEKRNELEDFLIKLSNVFFTDINVYSEEGSLIASSRRQIFDEGLVSEMINPVAYEKMKFGKESSFIQSESIGSMHFSSVYLPLYNDQNNLLGYVNLPYFSRQDELKKEISSFLVTFINIYILLIIFGVFIIILISNYITSPLALLAEKMSRLRLGRVNEKIEWAHSDEIGQLVKEYNRMIDELGVSAELLAQSERESAWREMARQIAHEIKNPLTPMKLSAQHLQKAWNENAQDMDERLTRFTKTLIEQIDTLSGIASDFSSFAKMPEVVNRQINLEEVVEFVCTLYRDTSDIRYDFHREAVNPYVFADRALLVRIFTNLINNSIHAIGESKNGVISIRLTNESGNVVLAISDNGSGISTDKLEKIFQPDFTTKTGGMGLGLAIVKSIVTNMNGEISVTSVENQGTTFIIKLPAEAGPKNHDAV